MISKLLVQCVQKRHATPCYVLGDLPQHPLYPTLSSCFYLSPQEGRQGATVAERLVSATQPCRPRLIPRYQPAATRDVETDQRAEHSSVGSTGVQLANARTLGATSCPRFARGCYDVVAACRESISLSFWMGMHCELRGVRLSSDRGSSLESMFCLPLPVQEHEMWALDGLLTQWKRQLFARP